MKIKSLFVTLLVMGFGVIPEPVNATPVKCYIGAGGSHSICDIEEVQDSAYLILWPDGDLTAMALVSTGSGNYAEVSHARRNGSIYGGGTRYLAVQGSWICLYRQPGGHGGIDFCVADPR